MRPQRLIPLGAPFVALALLAPALPAQQTLDSRWLPWVGCWEPTAETASPANPLICIRRTPGGDGVTVATIVKGEVASTRTLIADARTHPLDGDGCSGWQSASFSSDARRAYLRSDATCQGGVARTASAIMAIAPHGVWLDAQSIGMDGKSVPRVTAYRVAPESRWPAEFALRPGMVTAVTDARLLAAAPLTLADVEEATQHVDPEALNAFLVELGQPFDLDAQRLQALADAGVPRDVIDVVVAVSFPNRFQIEHQPLTVGMKPEQPPAERHGDRYRYAGPFGWGYYGLDQCYDALWYCAPYAYWASGLGYGWYNPYLYGPYGYGYGPYGYGYGPIIIVQAGGAHGQAVNGRGYTRGGQPTGTTGHYAHRRSTVNTDRSASSASAPRSASPSTGSASASPRGYTRGGSSSSSSRGSAKPRCCRSN